MKFSEGIPDFFVYYKAPSDFHGDQYNSFYVTLAPMQHKNSD